MTAAAVAPPRTAVRASDRSARAPREVRGRTATTAPDVRRARPSTSSRRPGGAPAPTLRRGALPDRLRPAAAPMPMPSTGTWRLTDRAIGLILAAVAVLMLTSLAVVVVKAIQVTAPATAYAATH